MQNVTDGGGSERALIASIAQLRADGWECHVALGGPALLAEEYRRAGAVIHFVAMRRLTTSGGPQRWVAFAATWPFAVLRLALLARHVRASVVHTNSLHCWYGWAAAPLVGKPHVWHAREIVAQSAAALAVERWLARRYAERVVAVSTAVGEQLDPVNVEVVLDSADPERFTPKRAGNFREAAGISDGVPLVGSVARIDTWKGFEVLLDAVPYLQVARPDLQLIVAGAPVGGKDRYAADLARRAASMAGVHWLGPRDDIPELMADLDVFVQVST
ncbi:MAG: glycosyltransferase family 4 protein, partial [Acidimicrobiales bacterium]